MYTVIIALAGLAGFVLEWRRDNRREADVERRIDTLEAQVAELQAWRDRMQRAQ